jgi:GTP diphosphokinase / guanosine-3',5'-bis(diphosphate) 3'-diphosphatase
MKPKYFLQTQDIRLFSQVDLALCAQNLWLALKSRLGYLSNNDLQIVELAFTQMTIAHDQMKRKSGEFYIIHPVGAAYILAGIGLDCDTLCACLMHDVPEDTKVTLKDLSKDFNPEVVFLIQSVTKLSTIKYQGEDRYAENLRKMFVAMSKDLRVVFIKMADRLHNLHTLEFLPKDKQERIARESMEIYAPLAERLGMGFFRGEIEDVCFKILYRDDYDNIASQVSLKIEERMKIVDNVKNKITHLLNQNLVNYIKVSGRAKKYYSIWNKIKSKNHKVEGIDDLVALRVIVPTVDECYKVISLIHSNFEPKEGRFKDYINYPKFNGYQSLHTSVVDPKSGTVFEVQIRTEAMHQFAEYGVASHWSYKSKNKDKEMEKLMKNESYKWISELVDLGKQAWSQEDYLQHVKLDIFNDRIFVLTPKNDAIDLPKGASILDFAYRIHNEVGSHAVMGKVNDKIGKLSDTLENGDKVEILTDKKQKPSRDWLNFVKTTHASKSIRNYLRQNSVLS